MAEDGRVCRSGKFIHDFDVWEVPVKNCFDGGNMAVSGALVRVDSRPNDETLAKWMGADRFGRNQELVALLSLIDDIEGGYSLLVDAPWGDGKTVLVRQAKLLLDHLSFPKGDDLESVRRLLDEGGVFSGVNLKHRYVSVYYSAWDNECYGNPLASLTASIAEQIKGVCVNDSTPVDTKERVQQIVSAVGKLLEIIPQTSVLGGAISAASTLGEALETHPSEYFSNLQQRRQLEQELSRAIVEALPDEESKLVLFVDELDRCAPSFAITVLREIKSLFYNDRVLIVLSADVSELANALSGRYGTEYHAEEYLSRFYDTKMCLSRPRPEMMRGGYNPQREAGTLINDLIGGKRLTIRQAEQYLQELDRYTEGLSVPSDGGIISFFFLDLAPVLLLMKQVDDGLFRVVTQDYDGEKLLTFVSGCEEVMYLYDRYAALFVGSTEEDAEGPLSDRKRKAIIDFLSCALATSFSSKDSDVWRESYTKLSHSHLFLGGYSGLAQYSSRLLT